MKKEHRISIYILFLMGSLSILTNSCKNDDPLKKDPYINWSNPNDIISGTLLSTTQLNATSDVPGTFVYTPPVGTKLNEGLKQDLKVEFTPTDENKYNSANKTVSINVNSSTTISDIDGNIYHAITIGSQVWLAENLKVTHFRNGETIETTTPAGANIGESTLPYQWGYNDPIYFRLKDSIYGRLYNWYAVIDPRNICPSGWHVPSDSEWTTLTDFLGGEKVAGGKLKVTDTIYWKSPNIGATDEYCFTALPGGYRYATGEFRYLKEACNFWTSTPEPFQTIVAINRLLIYDNTTAYKLGFYKGHGASVRCIKD